MMNASRKKFRSLQYAGLAAALSLGAGFGYWYDFAINWKSSGDFHTVLETASTVLALVTGMLALARFYAKPALMFLLLGAGLIGAGLLDLYHAVVTSSAVSYMMPSDNTELIPWSWVASRQYLALFLLMASAARWYIGDRKGKIGITVRKRFARNTYFWSAIYGLSSFFFFAFIKLPPAHYPDMFFHRPGEFVPAFLFLLALIVFYRKGHWKTDPLEHWIVIALIMNFASEFGYISHSEVLFDYPFDVAHVLKLMSYLCIFTGLTRSLQMIFASEHQSALSLTEANMNLSELEEKSSAIIEGTAEGIITIDGKGIIQKANQALLKTFGYEGGDILGQNISMLIPKDGRSKHGKYIENSDLHAPRIIDRRRELFGIRKDKVQIPLELTVSKINVGGELHFVGIVRDIGQRVADREALKAANAALKEALQEAEFAKDTLEQQAMDVIYLAEDEAAQKEDLEIKIAETAEETERAKFEAGHDPLTALLNRRGLTEASAKYFETPAANGASLVCLFLDLDGFKGVNDRLGHDIGDFVLQRMASALTAEVRPSDLVARIGGDEFVVLLTGYLTPAAAEVVAKRILRIPGALEVGGSREHGLGFSIGMAFYPDHAGGLENLLKCADQAMYAAKNSGKGRFHIFAKDQIKFMRKPDGMTGAAGGKG